MIADEKIKLLGREKTANGERPLRHLNPNHHANMFGGPLHAKPNKRVGRHVDFDLR